MTSPAVTGETHCLSTVMPGFMPGIHVFARCKTAEDVDGRDKPGHDECGSAAGHQLRPGTSPAMTSADPRLAISLGPGQARP